MSDWLFKIPWTAACQASLSITNSWSLLKHVHWVSDAIQPSHPLLSPSLSAFNLSQHQCLFQWVGLSISGQSIGNSASASVLAMNTQGWFSLGLTGLTSLLSKGLLRVFSSTTVWKHQFFGTQPSLWSNSHLYTTTEKAISLTKWTFVGKVMSLLFNMLSRFVLAFLPRIKRLLISWRPSPSAVVLEPKKIKSVTASAFGLLFAMKWWDWMPWSSFFECWVLSQHFHSLLSALSSICQDNFLSLWTENS